MNWVISYYFVMIETILNLVQATSVSHDCTVMRTETTVIKTEPWRFVYLIARSAMLILTNPAIPSAGGRGVNSEV